MTYSEERLYEALKYLVHVITSAKSENYDSNLEKCVSIANLALDYVDNIQVQS